MQKESWEDTLEAYNSAPAKKWVKGFTVFLPWIFLNISICFLNNENY